VISSQGVATNPDKIVSIESWPTPQNVKELHSFLVLTGYYMKFVRHFGIISHPLTNLLKKRILFVWTAVHEKAFQTLKQALVTTPVLALPDFSKTLIIETDSSDQGNGGCAHAIRPSSSLSK
jgi:hypothetical protein